MTSPTEPRTPRLYHAASDSAFTALGGFMVLLASMATLLFVGAVATQLGASPLVALTLGELGLVLVPVVAVVRSGRGPGALGLRRAPPLYVLAAVLLGASAWYVNLRLITLIELPENKVQWLEQLAKNEATLGPTLLALAVVPALCEELVFRGMLVQALATRLVPVAAVVVSALLFSAYHLSLVQAIPTFTLGLVLGLVALRARSVAPTIIAHLLNNSIALLADRLSWVDAHPTAMLIGTSVATAAGVTLAFVPERPHALPSARARYGDGP